MFFYFRSARILGVCVFGCWGRGVVTTTVHKKHTHTHTNIYIYIYISRPVSGSDVRIVLKVARSFGGPSRIRIRGAVREMNTVCKDIPPQLNTRHEYRGI